MEGVPTVLQRRKTRRFRLAFAVDAANVGLLAILAARRSIPSRLGPRADLPLDTADLAAIWATPVIAAGGLALAARALRLISRPTDHGGSQSGAERSVLVGGVFNAVATLVLSTVFRGSHREHVRHSAAAPGYLLIGASAITAVYVAILRSRAS